MSDSNELAFGKVVKIMVTMIAEKHGNIVIYLAFPCVEHRTITDAIEIDHKTIRTINPVPIIVLNNLKKIF